MTSLCVFAVAVSTVVGQAEQSTAQRGRAIIPEVPWDVAWEQEDVEALAEYYTEDADLIFWNGQRFSGREGIKKGFAKWFAERRKLLSEEESQKYDLEIHTTLTQRITPEVRVCDGIWQVRGLPEGHVLAAKRCWTDVFVRQDDKILHACDRVMTVRLPGVTGGKLR